VHEERSDVVDISDEPPDGWGAPAGLRTRGLRRIGPRDRHRFRFRRIRPAVVESPRRSADRTHRLPTRGNLRALRPRSRGGRRDADIPARPPGAGPEAPVDTTGYSVPGAGPGAIGLRTGT